MAIYNYLKHYERLVPMNAGIHEFIQFGHYNIQQIIPLSKTISMLAQICDIEIISDVIPPFKIASGVARSYPTPQAVLFSKSSHNSKNNSNVTNLNHSSFKFPLE